MVLGNDGEDEFADADLSMDMGDDDSYENEEYGWTANRLKGVKRCLIIPKTIGPIIIRGEAQLNI
jgi:hypothetical protein